MKKGQTNNPNGRPKGTPNKTTTDLRKWLDELLSKNVSVMENDLAMLEPKERLTILERFMQYTIPKHQSISLEAQLQAEYASLQKLLDNAPEKAIEAITERLIKLNKLNNKNNE